MGKFRKDLIGRDERGEASRRGCWVAELRCSSVEEACLVASVSSVSIREWRFAHAHFGQCIRPWNLYRLYFFLWFVFSSAFART